MKLPDADLHDQQDAQPTSNLPSPAAYPITPGVKRPAQPPEPHPLSRLIPRGLAIKVARFFGFTDYIAEVRESVIGVYILADLTRPETADDTRTGADYRIFTVDLSSAGLVGSRVPIPGSKDLVASNVALVSLTAGATVSLHVGDRDPIPFGSTGLGVGSSVEMDPPEQIVLAVTNPVAQPAANAQFLVSTGARINN